MNTISYNQLNSLNILIIIILLLGVLFCLKNTNTHQKNIESFENNLHTDSLPDIIGKIETKIGEKLGITKERIKLVINQTSKPILISLTFKSRDITNTNELSTKKIKEQILNNYQVLQEIFNEVKFDYHIKNIEPIDVDTDITKFNINDNVLSEERLDDYTPPLLGKIEEKINELKSGYPYNHDIEKYYDFRKIIPTDIKLSSDVLIT
jgi:hypothetical protein